MIIYDILTTKKTTEKKREWKKKSAEHFSLVNVIFLEPQNKNKLISIFFPLRRCYRSLDAAGEKGKKQVNKKEILLRNM